MRQEMGWFDLKENGVGALCTRLSTDASLIQGVKTHICFRRFESFDFAGFGAMRGDASKLDVYFHHLVRSSLVLALEDSAGCPVLLAVDIRFYLLRTKDRGGRFANQEVLGGLF